MIIEKQWSANMSKQLCNGFLGIWRNHLEKPYSRSFGYADSHTRASVHHCHDTTKTHSRDSPVTASEPYYCPYVDVFSSLVAQTVQFGKPDIFGYSEPYVCRQSIIANHKLHRITYTFGSRKKANVIHR